MRITGVVRCLFVGHRGTWEPRNKGTECEYLWWCSRCERMWFKEDHDPRYIATDSCDQKCSRCKQYTGDDHDWGPFSYAEPGQCTQVRECNRCHQTEHGGPEHVTTWKYI